MRGIKKIMSTHWLQKLAIVLALTVANVTKHVGYQQWTPTRAWLQLQLVMAPHVSSDQSGMVPL
jgi:hypothetical protein